MCVLTQPLTQGNPIHTRQHQIQNDQIKGLGQRKVEATKAVVGTVNDVTLQLKIVGDILENMTPNARLKRTNSSNNMVADKEEASDSSPIKRPKADSVDNS